jgi:hypothetical protein
MIKMMTLTMPNAVKSFVCVLKSSNRRNALSLSMGISSF